MFSVGASLPCGPVQLIVGFTGEIAFTSPTTFSIDQFSTAEIKEQQLGASSPRSAERAVINRIAGADIELGHSRPPAHRPQKRLRWVLFSTGQPALDARSEQHSATAGKNIRFSQYLLVTSAQSEKPIRILDTSEPTWEPGPLRGPTSDGEGVAWGPAPHTLGEARINPSQQSAEDIVAQQIALGAMHDVHANYNDVPRSQRSTQAA